MYKTIKMAVFVATLCPVPVAAQNDSTGMREVVVTGTRAKTDLRHLPLSVNVVGRDALTQGGRQDLLPTLAEMVPGLIVTRRGMMGYGVSTGAAGAVGIRGLGSTSGQLLMLIDGHPQYNGIYNHALADSYRTLMAEKVEVVRGPASMLYGSNAMGGVVNIVTREHKEDGTHSHLGIGAGSYNTMQVEGSTQTRCGKYSSTIGAQYGRSDNHRPDMEFEQWGGFLKLGYDLNSHWKAQGNVDLTHWTASNPGPVTARLADNDQYITRIASTLNIDNRYDKTSGGLNVYCNSGRHKINDGYRIDGGTPQTDYFRSEDAMAGVALWQTFKLCSGNRITTGIDYQCIKGHAYYTDMQTDTVVTAGKRGMQSTDKHLYEIAAYVDVRQELSRWMTLDVGVRFDHHSAAGGEWIPQVGLAYRPTRGGELKATVGKGFRNPSVKELYLYGSRNADLQPERLMNYELAWHQRVLGGKLKYGANLYYMKGDNIIMTVENHNVNSGEIQNHGLELEAMYSVNSHWSLMTNHSIMGMKHHIAYTPHYKGNLSGTYRHDKFSLTATLQQLTGLYTVQNGAYATADSHKEDVTLLSAHVTYHAVGGVDLWVSGENLLAARYEYVAGYPMPRATAMAGVQINLKSSKHKPK